LEKEYEKEFGIGMNKIRPFRTEEEFKEGRRDYMRDYSKTEKGKKINLEAVHRYRKTEKGKFTQGKNKTINRLKAGLNIKQATLEKYGINRADFQT